MTKTILVADDHPLILDSLSGWISKNPEYKLIGQVTDGMEALKLCLALKPDLLILDLNMPTLSGVQLLAYLVKAKLATKVVILSNTESAAQVEYCFKAGASGYIFKSSSLQLISQAIEKVLAGQEFLDPTLIDSMNSLRILHNNRKPEIGKSAAILTNRELEVLTLLAQGITNNQIANQLNISLNTATGHLKSIFAKLDVSSRLEALNKARKLNLINE